MEICIINVHARWNCCLQTSDYYISVNICIIYVPGENLWLHICNICVRQKLMTTYPCISLYVPDKNIWLHFLRVPYILYMPGENFWLHIRKYPYNPYNISDYISINIRIIRIIYVPGETTDYIFEISYVYMCQAKTSDYISVMFV